MGSEAKAYLEDHGLPELFEGLMTGLIYNKPENPLEFLENALRQIRANPNVNVSWDMFIKNQPTPNASTSSAQMPRHHKSSTPIKLQHKPNIPSQTPKQEESKTKQASVKKKKVKPKAPIEDTAPSETKPQTQQSENMRIQRVPSVIKAAEVARIPNVPIVLFMGGPGGGKTRHAERVSNALIDKGLVHICMPDIIRNALSKYKDHYSGWKDAHEKYMRGELIPNNLALALVKAEMGRHPEANAFFLEGFPREARQVEDFEREVKSVNMAIIIDYDEATLREHMERRGIAMDIIDQRIKEFKQKTLPSAKYFDDQRLLHLIPGEKEEQVIFERMKKLILQAIETGVPVYNANPPAQAISKGQSLSPVHMEQAETIDTHINGHTAEETQEEEHLEKAHLASPPKTANGKPPIESKPSSRPASRSSVPRTGPPSKKSSIDHSRPQSKPLPTPPKTPKNIETTMSTPQNNDTPVAENPTTVQTIATVHEPPRTPKTADHASQPRTFPKGLPKTAPVILVIGAPGSNKYALAQRITKKYTGFVMFSMGDLLRRKVRETRGDELWERIGRKMDNGETVPMKLCRELLYAAIQDVGATSSGYVIEGYPRSRSQAVDFEQQIERIDMAFLIDCTEQFCAANVKKRYETGLTDRNERPDDATEIFNTRLEHFKTNGLPMLKYLDEKSLLKVVDGDLEEDAIFEKMVQIIDENLAE